MTSIILGALCFGIPICTYAMIKDYKNEIYELDLEQTKEQIEITKLKIENAKLEEKLSGQEIKNVNTKGMF